MQHHHFNVLNRRDFLTTAGKAGILAALASVSNVPGVLRRALAAGTIGNGKKVLFIWLRGANDSLNSIIPVGDPAYVSSRTNIRIPFQGGTSSYYTNTSGIAADDFQAGAASTYGSYPNAIRLGNGYAGLHPSLKFLAPVYNAGDLAIIHRVAYPKQSRSHFDSQNYWENGNPNNNLSKDGIFYRAIYEMNKGILPPQSVPGVAGVSIQSSLPLILRGSAAALTNLTDPLRYNLLSIPSPTGDPKTDASITAANGYGFAPKQNREMLYNQYASLQQTLTAFAAIDFTEAGNTYQDSVKTDSDANWEPVDANNNPIAGSDPAKGYFLFPTTNDKNGGWRRKTGPPNTPAAADGNKYVVNPGHQSFFYNLRAAALVLNNTDAVIAGTELGGFDTHLQQVQGTFAQNQSVLGNHADLQRVIGWSIFGLRKYFSIYGRGGTAPTPGAKASWNDVVVVTLSEFGRTTRENNDNGTDHAEACAMWLAGGAIKGYNKGNPSGVFNCGGVGDPVSAPWVPDTSGSMFGVSSSYLKRNTDFRSVLGEVIRKHLGATDPQINLIIPGYASEGTEHLRSGGVSTIDSTQIRGEVGIL